MTDGCDRPPVGRGLCNAHWKAHRLATDPEYRERKNAAWRAWADAHPHERTAAFRQWRTENAERHTERLREWREDNPAVVVAYGWTRRRRIYGLPEDIVELVDPGVVFDRDQGTCQLCHSPVDPDLTFPHPLAATLDHTVPVSEPSSTHSYANTVLAHWDCNRRKHTRESA